MTITKNTPSIEFNPLNIQLAIIEGMEAKLNGVGTIVDTNSTAMHLIEAFSAITAAVVLEGDRNLEKLYPKRARSMGDLYRHMSDYDHVDMFANPSSMILKLSLGKKYVERYAKDYNDHYKKIVIPKNTVFEISGYQFGLYYPIEIKINKHSDSITAGYDTSVENPLYKLDTNQLDVVEFAYGAIDFISIAFPVFQFNITSFTGSLLAYKNTGYVKTAKYIDKFYAFTAYHLVKGVWVEMRQNISEDIYDHSSPTIKFKVYPESNQLRLEIPPIYYELGLIGDKIYVEIYGTKGDLEVNLSRASLDTSTANFIQSPIYSYDYTHILKRNPSILVHPENGQVAGGNDGIDFETTRNHVINDDFQTGVLVRTTALKNYLLRHGFKLQKYLDNLTNRIYYGYKTLTDTRGNVIHTTEASMEASDDAIKDVSTIITNYDGSVTVLPATIFTYVDTAQAIRPLTDDERYELTKLAPELFVEHVNASSYVKTPFTVLVIRDVRNPRAISYNLTSCNISSIYFMQENIELASTMKMISAAMVHLNDGVGGYKLRLVITRSTDLTDTNEDDIYMCLMTKNSHGGYCSTRLERVSEDIYEVTLTTTYHLKEEGYININSMSSDISSSDNFIALESDFYIVTMVNRDSLPSVVEDNTIYEGIPADVNAKYMALSKQKMKVHFGHALTDVIYNAVDFRQSAITYKVHEYDIHRTYTEDKFKTDSSGNFVYEDDPAGMPQLILEHSKGDVMLDDNDDPIIQYAAGTVVYDPYGNPIPSKSRTQRYDTKMIVIDYKQYASENPAQINSRNELISNLERYFDVIRATLPNLIEQTKLYFNSIKTFGTAQFGIGDGLTIRRQLELVFSVKCYIKEYVASDEVLQAKIRNTITSLIKTGIANRDINMVELGNTITSTLSDYIEYVDVVGIDGTNRQTLLVINEDSQPSLKQSLFLTKDKKIELRETIDLEYIVNN